MILRLKSEASGLGGLGKTEKVYLENTNIMQALVGAKANAGAMRETFFFNQTRQGYDVTASTQSDFQIADVTFEVGGKNKGFDQLKGSKRGFVAADDIEYGHGNIIPLWAFGLLY